MPTKRWFPILQITSKGKRHDVKARDLVDAENISSEYSSFCISNTESLRIVEGLFVGPSNKISVT